MLNYRKGLEALKSYTVDDIDRAIKLENNERPTNLPPAVSERLFQRLADVQFNRYPELAQQSLKQQIAAGFGLEPDNVSIGSGSSELLVALCYIFGGPGRKIVFPSPSFSMYPIYCQLSDSQPVSVKLDADFNLSAENLVSAAKSENASLILMCNPNNPTGTTMSASDVEYMVKNAPCPVVVDEAYYDFFQQTAVGLLAKYPNLIIVRTFSKAYSLASARVGYALAGKEITSALAKALLPYHVNTLSLTAASVVYEMRQEFAAGIAQTVAERERLTKELGTISGMKVFPSKANFILIRHKRAAELAAHLAQAGISIRDYSKSPVIDGLRVTIGTPTENDAFLTAVQALLK
jgi:histidinol-phosphate aminotransferase